MPQEEDQPPIFVTRPSLPDLQELIPSLEEIWAHQHVTNNGYYHSVLEDALRDYLEVPYISLTNNGTLALMVALKAANITGEVITTPFTFVATTQSLAWNGLIPVFADIEKDGFNLDPASVERLITPRTSAILAVHCYGFPCQHDALQKIADKHGLKLIYDACHAFGVKDRGQSLLNLGDMATLSFHGTKVFNTFEGGAIICHDADTKRNIDNLKNFGIIGEFNTESLGINAKMQEFSSALGVLQLRYIDDYIQQRRRLHKHYSQRLSACPTLQVPSIPRSLHYNYAYLPIVLKEDHPEDMESLYARFRANQIFARRYFYPPIHQSDPFSWCHRDDMSQTDSISPRVICLPLYPTLMLEEADRVCDCLLEPLS